MFVLFPVILLLIISLTTILASRFREPNKLLEIQLSYYSLQGVGGQAGGDLDEHDGYRMMDVDDQVIRGCPRDDDSYA